MRASVVRLASAVENMSLCVAGDDSVALYGDADHRARDFLVVFYTNYGTKMQSLGARYTGQSEGRPSRSTVHST